MSAETFIRLQSLSKRFGDFTAVDNIDLDIHQGELFAILGGSGCGKTTLLRMLAGFETPSSGSIEIDGVDVSTVPAYRRPVNMMFQSYALFPHMSVEKNIAYGLRKENMPKPELNRRVDTMLELTQLVKFRRRKPSQLSGGQRQRVALARALAKRPKVLLLDEPLAALDKKLREHTQFELMDLQHELGITFVVVTHDQEEAMTLADRIAVMEQGRFQQVGSAKEVYEYPATRFVAEFIGSINTFSGTVDAQNNDKTLVRCADPDISIEVAAVDGIASGQRVTVAVRPEKIFVARDRSELNGDIQLRGTVDDLGYLGNRSLYRIRLDSGKVLLVSSQNRRRSIKRFLEWDDKVWVSWNPASTIVLSR